MLSEKEDEIRKTYGRGVRVTAIVTRSKGTVVDPSGIDLLKACGDIDACGRFADGTPGLCGLSAFDVLRDADYDAVCELTPLNIFTGQPAIDHIKAAFARGKHVVSANKGPIAWAFDELSAMAAEKGCLFFYETTVMDGTPVFNLVEHAEAVPRDGGIRHPQQHHQLYFRGAGQPGRRMRISSRRARRWALSKRTRPWTWTATMPAAKVTALLNVLMKAHLTPDKVDRTGIAGITAETIKEAAVRGKVIKLLCKGRPDRGPAAYGPVSNRWRLTEMTCWPPDSTTSVVSITTDLMGKLSVIEHAPEIQQTAYRHLRRCAAGIRRRNSERNRGMRPDMKRKITEQKWFLYALVPVCALMWGCPTWERRSH